MELEELKATLAALDRHLERLAASDARETERRTRRAVRSSLRPLAIGNVVQVAFGLLAILLGVATWRSDLVRFGDVFISGVVVHAYGAATIGLAVATLVMIGRIDQAGPVLAVQKRLAELRRLLITAAYALGMTWWVLWVPFGIAIFRVAFGVDLFAHAPDVALVLVASGVVGFVASALVHRWAVHSGRPRVAAAFDSALTGTSFRRAKAHLDELSRFAAD